MEEKKYIRSLTGKVSCCSVLWGTMLCLFLLPSGCSSDESGNSSDNDLVEIRLNGGISSSTSVSTRGAGVFNGTDTWSDDLAVRFARSDKATDYTAGYLSTPLDAVVSKTATGDVTKTHIITFGTALNPSPAYYLANGNKSKLIGWYPSTGTFDKSAHTVAFPAATLDGSTDLMATNLYEGDKNTKITSVAFNHLLTQISVRVYTESTTTATVWGTLSSVSIVGMSRSCIVILPAATAATTGGTEKVTIAFSGSDNLSLVKKNPSGNSDISYPVTPGIGAGNSVLAGYAMFAPQTDSDNANNMITLTVITSAGGTHTAAIPAPDGGFKAGSSYVVTLKFGAAEIEPSVSITDWQTGKAPGEVEI